VRAAPVRSLDGRWLLVAALACYFGLLIGGWAANGTAPWVRFRVAAATPSFLDMRSITTGWECTRKGVDPLPLNPCDPRRRPANYPRIWLKLSWLGLGEGSTVALGIATAVIFFLAALLFVGPLTIREALVYLAILLSPSVMIGVERGNADLLVFAVVVLALAAFGSRRLLVRAGSHALLLFAAILKLFPVFGFVAVARQERRIALIAGSLLVALFALDVALTWHDIRTIYAVVPKLSIASYGYAIGPDASRAWLARHVSTLDFLTTGTARDVVDAVVIALALLAAFLVARRAWPRRRPNEPGEGRLVSFWAGAGIYLGTFLIGHNFDYRLCFLVLTVPQLLVWARDARPPVPGARWALCAMVATLWLSEALMPRSLGIADAWASASRFFPPEEALNWFLFVYFTAALLLTAPDLKGGTTRSAGPRTRAVEEA
jgi:hypothetical protein